MNIGIVTIYDGNNMGSFLQAAAFKETLESLGHNVFFVQRMTEDENYKMFVNRSFSKCRPFPLNYLANLKRAIVNRREDVKKRDEIKKIYAILKKERRELPLIKVSEIDKIDLLICGSDEIWNFNNTSISVPFYTCCDFGKNIRKIAFAVSVGTSFARDFKSDHNVLNALTAFSSIYVRDNHSKEVIDQVTGKNHSIVCDPTLLIGRNYFLKENKRIIEEPYLMIYAYELNKQELKYIRSFAKNKGLSIVSVLHYSPIADKIVTESPYNFAKLISNASYCYTSTFHGTIFCALFARKFVYRARRPKVKEIAEYLKVNDREWIDGDYHVFENLMNSDINRPEIDRRLEEIRETNVQILEQIVNQG